MNIFNVQAAEAGRAFAHANPKATDADIDWAAPALNPARRHFQEAARDFLRKQVRLFSWSIGVATHSTSGFAPSYEEAVQKIREMNNLYKKENVNVLNYSVEDPDGVCVLSMDTST